VTLPLLAKSHPDMLTAQRRIAETVNNVLTFQFDDSRIRSIAEVSAGVTVLNASYPIGDARRYGAKIDNVTDDTVAYQASIAVAQQSLSVEAYWPQGTARVNFLTLTASCRIRTAGKLTIFQQIAGQTPGTPIITIENGDVELGSCQGIGNIASDTGEQMHFIQVNGSATLRRVRLGDIAASHVRGDVLRIAGTAAAPVYNVETGTVTGLDVYRNLVSAVGVEDCYIRSIVNTGVGVGYRDFDAEPNPSGQFCTAIRIGYFYGANLQAAGGNISGGIGTLRVDHCDLDNSRLANATQAYPTFPGSSGNIGGIFGDVQAISFGTLKGRNYQERLLNSNGNTIAKVTLEINNPDISGCDTTETSVKNLINCDAAVDLKIRGGAIALAGVDRYITKGNFNSIEISRTKVSGGGVAAFATNAEFNDLQIDCASLAVGIFFSLVNCLIKNCTIINDSSATLFGSNVTGTLVVNTTSNPSALEGTGCAGNMAMNSTLKSILYGPPTLISAAIAGVNMNNANQTLTAIQGIAISITCTSTPTAMTATRNLVVPSTPRVYTVFNNNGAGFGIQVIASGTGITIADGKRAIVQCDGTNVVRITPDT